MSEGLYILQGKKPVLCSDLMEWARCIENGDGQRQVAKTSEPGVDVSTVFLGIDHSYNSDRPLLFETMVFGGVHDQD